ncbi:metallophosphoesterase [Pseudonocardia oroxyli]|uniref:Calcineurin-like phosphoesterase domain-containing protein n=1 Tax=Pseudonocardia oroxyli TaxID=366584 RepID=A0A1G7RX32_PSEOR|nr:metallophosphoesterase [Pseudonocardia oroxyli]SDG15383.1 hypothetical protein SAMN05216377_109170 [Pseudonocardia oroxyli]
MGFSLGILALLLLVHLYLYKRVVHDVVGSRRARIVGGVLLGALFALVAAVFLTRRVLPIEYATALNYTAYLWFAVLLYLGLALLVGELVRPAVRVSPERRRFLSGSIAAVAGVAAVGTVTYGAIEARRPRVERRDVLLDRLDPAFDGFTVAAVSDIHLEPLVDAEDLRGFVATLNAAGPDVVAVVGDLVDGQASEIGGYAEPLRDLVADTYFVTGNHEYYSGVTGWVDLLPTLGVRVLRNERVTLRRGDAVLHLAGCDDRVAAASGVPGHGFDLDRALAGRDPAEPVVLLAHQPVMVDQAARAGVDLQISGHTHGGQLTPLTHVALVDQPVLAGLTRVGPTWLYVTRGLGFWGPPVRVGSPPEITLLTLRAPGAPPAP